jgi:adenylate cyclase
MLGVDHVIEVTVRPRSDGVRVNVEVVEASTGITKWSKAFDSDRANLAQAGERIGASLVRDGGLGLAAPVSASLAHRPTPEAYDSYSRERFFVNRSAGRADYDSALFYFRRAVAADSSFAPPYATLATMYFEGGGTFTESVEYDYREAERLAKRAIELDASNADAHAAYGWTLAVRRWDWRGARRELEQAIALDPNSSFAHLYYGTLLSSLGEHEAAVNEGRRAVRLDPYHSYAVAILVSQWVALHQADSALAAARLIDATNPEFFIGESMSADALRMSGKLDSALVLDVRETRRNGGIPTSGLAVSLERKGRHADAERVYRALATFADTTHGFVLYEVVGRAAAATGHIDEAMRWFERAASVHSDLMLWIRFWPGMEPMLADARYQGLLKRIGVVH